MKLLSNDLSSSIEDELLKDCKNKELCIAVAFFSNSEFLKKAVSNGSSVRLVVRLGEGTSISELKKSIKLKDSIQIKYYTDKTFHPKVFLTGNYVYVGSANLTKSAFQKNNEVAIKYSKQESEKAFKEMRILFEDYWNKASFLDLETIKKVEKVYNSIKQVKLDTTKEIEKNIGSTRYTPQKKKINQVYNIEGKRIAITGIIQKYTRAEVGRLIKQKGGFLQDEVNSLTDYFVDTIKKTEPHRSKNGTVKQKDYLKQKNNGGKAKRISEKKLYEMLGVL